MFHDILQPSRYQSLGNSNGLYSQNTALKINCKEFFRVYYLETSVYPRTIE